MKRTLLVVSLIVGLVLSSCSAPAPAPSGPAAKDAPPSKAAVPTRGGSVTVVTGHEPQTLDHHLATGVYDGYLTHTLSDTLIRMMGDGKLVPALAESWEIVDPTTYVFKLRQNVTFHDGTAFNAEAVKKNFDRLFDPETKSARAKSRLGAFKAIDVVDPFTVRITTQYPYGPFLAAMAAEPIAAIQSPTAMEKWGLKDYGTHPIGTGPFVFQEWVQGDRVVFKANDAYWGGRPNIDTLTFKIVTDPGTRLTLLRTGAAQFVVEVPPQEFATLKVSPDFEVIGAPFDNTIFVEMSNIQPPFDNPLVRQAVCYAIDKDAIIRSVLLGVPPPGYGIFAATVWAKNPDAPKYNFDPTKAKQLLADAGMPNGFQTTLWHSNGRYMGDAAVAQAIQGYLRQVGIVAELKTGDLTAWANAMRGPAPESPGAPMYLRGWGALGDPDAHIQVLYHSSNWGLPGNYARYKNAQVDKLLEDARRETSQEARKRLYHQAETQITQDMPACTLYDNVRLLAHTKKLQGVEYGPTEYQFFHKAWLTQ